MDSFDVIIVGLGPSGASTALNLHKLAGRLAERTLVLEKAQHPRDKICGGGVSANSQSLLRDLGLRVDVPHVDVDNVRLKYGKRIVRIHEKDIYKIVRRSEFDASLARAVSEKGIEVHEDEKVIDVIRNGLNGVFIKTVDGEYKAKVVVGADGVGSVVRRKLLRHHREKLSRLCLIETPADPTTSREFVEKAVTVDYTYISHGLRGYIWDVPFFIDRQPYLNRGIFDRSTKHGKKADIRKIFRSALRERGIELDGQKLKWYPEREFNPSDVLSAPHALLVGDAAGIDPLMGEGIAQSLGYGELAAREIVLAFKNNNFNFKSYKKRILKARLGLELKTYATFANHLYGPKHEFWLSLLLNDESIAKMLAKCFAGRTNLHEDRLRMLGRVVRHRLMGDKNLT